MSWKATAYIKDVNACPDGAPMNRGQKLLALILADYHNTDHKAAWPSIPTLAANALTSHSQAKRDLAYLEEHRLIRKVRPERMGRGWVCAYEFPALDAPSESVKGVHYGPLFCARKRGPEGVHPETESSPEGVQKGFTASSAIRKNEELKQKQNEERGALIFPSLQPDLAFCGRCGGVGKIGRAHV